jgi:hypothetical protein
MRLVILAQDRQECLQLGRIVRGLFDHGGGRHDLGVQVAGDLAWKLGGGRDIVGGFGISETE